MRLGATLLLLVVSSPLMAQTIAPVPAVEDRQPKPLIRNEPPAYLWNSKLIRWEREGIIAPAARRPDALPIPEPTERIMRSAVDRSLDVTPVELPAPQVLPGKSKPSSIPIYDRFEYIPGGNKPVLRDMWRVAPDEK